MIAWWRHGCLRWAVPVVLALHVLLAGCTGPDKETGGPTPAPSGSGGPSVHLGRGCTVAAAGDIAGDDDLETGAARTAELISERDPAAVIAVGDLAYDSGTVEDFDRYYDPTWGAFKSRTLPVPGNHEYGKSEGSGYLDYFGEDAGENRGVDLCGWRILLVNQYDGITDGAEFIAEDAAAHPGVPLIVVWHAPRFSSGEEHGSEPHVQPLWSAAVQAGAEVVLNGHDHDYERFSPLDETGDQDPDGTTEIVTGLGGHKPHDFDDDIVTGSAARYTGTPAVLFLTLRSDGYSWEERSVNGEVVDQGQASISAGEPNSTAQPSCAGGASRTPGSRTRC